VPERKYIDLLPSYAVVEPVANPGEHEPSHPAEADVGGGRTQARLDRDERESVRKLVAEGQGGCRTILAPPRVSRFDLGGRSAPE
jgi:hypothetical protein